jgi:hypothetical protein
MHAHFVLWLKGEIPLLTGERIRLQNFHAIERNDFFLATP